MKVYIKKSDFFDSHNKHTRIQAIINYVNTLIKGHYYFEEIDQQAVGLYYVDYYYCQVRNGGISQYMHNSRFDKFYYNRIYAALSKMGATRMKEIFSKACEILANLSKDDLEKFINYDIYKFYGEIPELLIKDARDKLSKLDDEFFQCDYQSLEYCYEYIAKFKNLVIVEEDQYEIKMKKLLNAVPNYIERLNEAKKIYEESKPEYEKIIENVCETFNLKLLSVNSINHGYGNDQELQNRIDKNIYYYHITTDKGYCYIFMDEEKLITLVNGETEDVIGTITL